MGRALYECAAPLMRKRRKLFRRNAGDAGDEPGFQPVGKHFAGNSARL
ncbi:hypothetical protein LTSEJOH_0869, partial [Salmonella enterica subsp. enterica serovar Johannesburg str. S5-703]